MQVSAFRCVYLPLGLTVASPNAELNGPCNYLQPPSDTEQSNQRACEPGNSPTAVVCFICFIIIGGVVWFSFFLFAFHPLTPPLRFLPARRTSLPVLLLFVPFRQPVGINGNVNTARYRGNFTKTGIYFWAGAAGVGLGREPERLRGSYVCVCVGYRSWEQRKETWGLLRNGVGPLR